MIVNLFIDLFYGLLKGIIAILPSMSIMPDAFEDMWEFLATAFSYFLYIIPAGETVPTIINLIIAFEIAYWTFMASDWLYTKIRG